MYQIKIMRISQILVFVLVIAYFLQIILSKDATDFIFLFVLNPTDLKIWQLISSIFLHGSFLHLFLNCYALYFFGEVLEQRIGQRKFLEIFFLSGIFGNLLYLFTIYINIIPPIPALGASGAIYGIFGALVIFAPELRLLVFGFIPLKIKEAAVLWFILELIGTFDITSGIASAAHLGGLVVGYLLARHYEKEFGNFYKQFIYKF